MYFAGEASKQIHEYKLKLQKAEQDITNLEGTVSICRRPASITWVVDLEASVGSFPVLLSSKLYKWHSKVIKLGGKPMPFLKTNIPPPLDLPLYMCITASYRHRVIPFHYVHTVQEKQLMLDQVRSMHD